MSEEMTNPLILTARCGISVVVTHAAHKGLQE
jgi:hypothetical protein